MRKNTTLLLLLAAAGVGAYYWFVVRPKRLAAGTSRASNPQALPSSTSAADQAWTTTWETQHPGMAPV